jgi:ubiquinone/menaquinone biosynthesis C-methylase UbiE
MARGEMLLRVLEPEVMDSERDALEYDGIDNEEVNREFATRALDTCPTARTAIDLGTGPAHIPILLAQMAPQLHVTAVDLAEHMLALARRKIHSAGAQDRITLLARDAKATGLESGSFDLVMCNSLVHHLADPLLLLREAHRLTAPGGGLLVKDLLRPSTEDELQALVGRYAANDTNYQRKLFSESLRAALTLDEVERACRQAGLTDVCIERTSDRHYCVSRIGSA